MKKYLDEKVQGVPKMILFVEILTNVKCLGFSTFIRARKIEKVKN